MCFTGNPGSAKTTVARLLADILTDEGVLKSGSLVECGRADLVGRYVGWTAKVVRDKFKEAEGGILFVDFRQNLFGLFDLNQSRLGRNVAAVEKNVNPAAFDAFFRRPLEHWIQLRDVGVNVSV